MVTWQRWLSLHSIRHSWKPHATRKPYGSSFVEPELWAIKVYIAGVGIFTSFFKCVLSIYMPYVTLSGKGNISHCFKYREMSYIAVDNWKHFCSGLTDRGQSWRLICTLEIFLLTYLLMQIYVAGQKFET